MIFNIKKRNFLLASVMLHNLYCERATTDEHEATLDFKTTSEEKTWKTYENLNVQQNTF